MKILFPQKPKQDSVVISCASTEQEPLPLAPVFREPLDIVIDVSYLSYRSAYAYHDLMVKNHSPSGHVLSSKPSGHIYGSISAILNLHKDFSTNHNINFVFAFDGFPTWRKEQYPDYKLGRVKTLGFDPKEDVETILSNVPGIKIYNKDEEADDVIASYVTRESKNNKKIVIISADRDLWVLKSLPNVRIFGNKMEEVSTDAISSAFHTTRAAFVSVAKAVLGDDTDNLKKILRFPRKDLSVILDTMETPDIDSMLSSANNLVVTGKISNRSLQLLLENEDQLRKTFSLAKLRDIPFTESKTPHNKKYLESVLNAFGCVSLLPRIDCLYRGEHDH